MSFEEAEDEAASQVESVREFKRSLSRSVCKKKSHVGVREKKKLDEVKWRWSRLPRYIHVPVRDL
jgi:hypothetical protein